MRSDMASVHFLCPKCETRLAREAGQPPRPCDWCGADCEVVAPFADTIIVRCAVCAHDQLYVQKDFNRTTGITLVVIGSIFVPWTYGLSLLGVTILDYIVWRLVKDVIVCYRCGAEHRGVPTGPEHRPFELTVHERYRQERLRKEQIGQQ